MPREIADSDDEVDFAPKPPRKHTSIVQKEDAPPSTAERKPEDPPDPPDPMLNVDFDTFLSPTQRISSYDGNQDTSNEVHTLNVLDSSTDRFLNEVACAESHIDGGSDEATMGGKTSTKEKANKKRSRTQHDDRTSSRDDGSARKRTKAHHTGTASSAPSEAQMQFQAMINASDNYAPLQHGHSGAKDTAGSIDPTEMVSIEERSQYTEPLDLSLGLSTSNNTAVDGHAEAKNLDTGPMQPYTLHQAYTPRESFFGASLQGGTTSRSSMGNYQSFTIDPSALNVDFNKINPFGSLTQASLDGDVDSEETRALAGIFGNSAPGKSGVSHGSGSDAEMLLKNMQEMQTSPEKGASSMDAPEQLTAHEEPPQGSPAFSPITNPDDDNLDTEAVILHQDLEETAASEHHNVENVEEPVKPPPKKRGRKPKQNKPDDNAVHGENDMDELQVDETHAARAIRAGTVDSISNISEISQATTSSKTGRKRNGKKADMAPPEVLSKKLPSSDLGLDKKEVIGLSPERYVPRPSKRRGRAESEATSDTVAMQPDEPSQQTPSQETPAKATPAKGKKGKKTKVKSAKTSAAVLLVKSSGFLDNDEREEAKVMFVEKRPAKVKFSPVPELSPDRKLKKEELAEKPTEVDGDDEEVVKCGKRTANITVDVPAVNKSDDHEGLPPPGPEPKKRGRKKKVVEEPTEMPAAEEPPEERPALTEKDINVPAKKTKGTKSVQAKGLAADEEEEGDKEYDDAPEHKLDAPDSPIKAATPAPKTPHSPLKPPNSKTPLFNARTRIGLSKRHSIPSLLRRIDRNKEPPKAIEKKEKLNKKRLEEKEQERIAREEAEAEGREYVPPDLMRGKDGLLVEWDF